MAAETAPRMKILQLGAVEHAHELWAEIAATADIVVPRATNRADFLAECRTGALDGVQVVYRTFGSVAITGRVDAALLAALPATVRFVCHNGAGYDQVDVAACTARGVRVSNTPTAVDEATADLHLFLLLGALRNLAPALQSIRAGHWRGVPAPPALGHDPEGKILGVLGMGGIGRTVARKAHAAFGMRIRYHNRHRLAPAVEAAVVGGAAGRDPGGAEPHPDPDPDQIAYVPTLADLLATADVLSINVPLNAHTRHMLGAAEFAQMKPGIVLVNTARGAVLDEQALVDALASGRVASAGLDVFEHEPEVHPALRASDRVLLVPHLGTWTVETEKKMEVWTMENVRMAVTQGTLKSIVPEQANLAW